MNYYNEFDKKAAAWIRQLISDGLIPAGDVDERSITDVRPDDLVGYTQCHFFAGIGGWSIAARLAGWPEDKELWTGSCPCQPFSVAGEGKGSADARHLWPDFFRLIRSRRPAVVMGEQVAAAVGKDWLDGVFADLEGIGYACEAAIAPACAVNAPHRRDRLWFVAGSRLLEDAARRSDRRQIECGKAGWPKAERSTGRVAGPGGGDHGSLVNTVCAGLEERERIAGVRREAHGALTWQDSAHSGSVGGSSVPDSERERIRGNGPEAIDGAPRAVQGIDGERQWIRADSGAVCLSGISDVADSDSSGRSQGLDHSPAGHGYSIAATSRPGAWDSARWLIGHDGKARRVEPSIPLLVDGLPARAPLLRGYGNAIVPQEAAEVIGAWLDFERDAA